MSGTISLLPEARAYLDDVRSHLGDVAAEDREELLADVEAAVHDAAAEGGEPLWLRLGPPEAFAAELRAAAGLPPASVSAAAPPEGLRERLGLVARRLAADRRVRSLGELAPVWWVARAYVAVAAATLATGRGFSTVQPLFPAPLGGTGSLLLLLGAVALSVWIGLRRPHGRAPVVFDAVLAVAAVFVVVHVASTPRTEAVVVLSTPTAAAPSGSLVSDGEPVRNVYAFTRDGRMLLDVLLYDHRGEPLEIRSGRAADPLRRAVVSKDGDRLFNAFPIRYFEPGTQRVRRPRAAPRVSVPEIATPALGAQGP